MAKKKPTAKKATKKRVTTKKAATKASPAKKAAWRLYNDAVGAGIAGSTALLNLGKGDSVDTGAYSYLFSARNRFW